MTSAIDRLAEVVAGMDDPSLGTNVRVAHGEEAARILRHCAGELIAVAKAALTVQRKYAALPDDAPALGANALEMALTALDRKLRETTP